MDYLLNQISVEGEISNFKHHSNGNFYFSLKDERARINTIMYREDTLELSFVPKDGMKIVATGTVSFYENQGQTNFYITSLEEIGHGELYRKFLTLRDELEKKGLFSPNHKKSLPHFPTSVGIITSDTGAAVQDIINILHEKNDLVNIIVYPALVQGVSASESIIEGLSYFNAHPVDTIIIGRGGGSFEDLYAFNDEKLAYAIYQSNIPIISAVGHEIDYSISDFVADARAATPTKAAEMVTCSKQELWKNLLLVRESLIEQITKNLEEKTGKLTQVRYYFQSLNMADKISNETNSLRFSCLELQRNIEKKNQKERDKLRGISLQLEQQWLGYFHYQQKLLREIHQAMWKCGYVLYEKTQSYAHSLYICQSKLPNQRYFLKGRYTELQREKSKLSQRIQQNLDDEKRIIANVHEKIRWYSDTFYRTQNYKLQTLREFFRQVELSTKITAQKDAVNQSGEKLLGQLSNIPFIEKQNSLQRQVEAIQISLLEKIHGQRRELELEKSKMDYIYQQINHIRILSKTGKEIQELSDLSSGEKIEIQFKNGVAHAVVEHVIQMR